VALNPNGIFHAGELRRATGYWVPGVFNVVQCVPPSIVRCSEPRTVA